MVLVLLTGLNLVNYVDRYVMAAVLPKVQDDLQLSNFVGGSLATIFLIGYFATSPIFGILSDRSAPGWRKRLLTLGVSIWSVATVASGLARGTASLVAARAAVGVGEASYSMIAPTLIDDLATPEQRGRWMATFSAALPIGSALGYIVGGAIEHTHGWRAAFFVAGGPGLALALSCLLIAEPLRRRTTAGPSPDSGFLPWQRSDDLLDSARTLLRLPHYRDAVLGYCAYTFAVGGFGYWAPKYLHARYGMETGRASLTFGLLTVLGGFVGTVAGGWLADRVVRGLGARPKHGVQEGDVAADAAVARANLWVCAIGVAMAVPLSAAAIATRSSQTFFFLLVPCEIALFLSAGPVNVALLRSVPPELRASAMALSIFAIHLLGDLWSPLFIGLAADHAPMMFAMMSVPAALTLAAFVWQNRAFRAYRG